MKINIKKKENSPRKLTYGDIKDGELFIVPGHWPVYVKVDEQFLRWSAVSEEGYRADSEGTVSSNRIYQDTPVLRVTGVEYTVEEYA